MVNVTYVASKKTLYDLYDERTTPRFPPPMSHDHHRWYDDLKSYNIYIYYDGVATMVVPYLPNDLSQHRTHTTYCVL